MKRQAFCSGLVQVHKCDRSCSTFLSKLRPQVAIKLTIAVLSAITYVVPGWAQTPPQTASPDSAIPTETDSDNHPSPNSTSNSDPANNEVAADEDAQVPAEDTTSTEAVPEAYTLGTGDRINISIFGAPDYSGEALVLPDGSLNLPTAGSVEVRGLTLQAAAQAIAQQYAPFVNRPRVTVTLVSLRPVRVGIAGAVNRPGSYTLSSEEQSEFPTLTDAIQTAGGITSRANLRQIQIRRQQPGSEQVININLWEMLQSGDLSKDIVLHGGDTVFIPTAEALAPADALQLGTASFAPDTVRVYVVGEVGSPGSIDVPANTPLNQAILAAGGFNQLRAEADSVKLVRLNPDGTVSQQTVSVEFDQDVNEDSNPTLQNNDVIVVGRSDLANFSATTEMALGPFGRIISSFLGILNIFN
jgi:polysaccharide export outer membrane protein